MEMAVMQGGPRMIQQKTGPLCMPIQVVFSRVLQKSLLHGLPRFCLSASLSCCKPSLTLCTGTCQYAYKVVRHRINSFISTVLDAVVPAFSSVTPLKRVAFWPPYMCTCVFSSVLARNATLCAHSRRWLNHLCAPTLC